MIVPTQTQIEAAKILVKKLREWNDCAFDPDGPGLSIQEVYDMRDQMREAAELLAALTAAAEVGEATPDLSDPGIDPTIRNVIAATIERCAQWLEDNYPSAKTIALQMRRAMKEKP